ncbi:MAG: DUF2092 domain-containing protein [Leptolyngbyaceae cyanobacterium RU_5_1]|nr:DUF2092 domain-containing protein [Leptolyngbyaceae cyanobacterium RU_5_1]
MTAILKVAALVSVAVALSGLSTIADASRLMPAHPNATGYPSIPKLISQLNSKPNLSLLARASAVFVQSDRYQTESEMQIKAVSVHTTVTSSARTTTLVLSPHQFRAEIVFSQSGSATPSKSVVVSDGKQVWMYRPDLKQYKVVPYKAFDDADDNYWIGLSSLWFLEISPEVRKPIAEGALGNPTVLRELGVSDSQLLKGGTQTVDGQAVYTYEFTDKDGFTIGAVIEPKTAVLKQIRLTGKSDGYNVDIIERILRRTANPAIAANTFKFTPPADAKEVKTLAIGPL